MTPNSHARQLFAQYENFKLDQLRPSNCRHAMVIDELRSLSIRSRGLLSMEELGTSLEGRSIYLLRCGMGTKRVLLWSQMHGDESTATLALCDLFNFLVEMAATTPWVTTMLGQISMQVIPLLNPDGAEAVRRHTATAVDMNRDARVLATPEARILRETHRALNPAFGFNLHDQDLSSVGSSKKVAALSLLAPALDEKKTRPLSRLRAMRVCAVIARAMHQFVDGHIATYDDAFEPRAFGDRIQSWGTSTILIESGHWPKDREKTFVRKLNFISLLTALRSIGNGSFQDVELEHYVNLKQNGKQMYDLIIRNLKIAHSSGWFSRADVGISLGPEENRRSDAPLATIKEVGDLSTHTGLETLDGSARRVRSDLFAIEKQISLSDLLDALQIYHGGS